LRAATFQFSRANEQTIGGIRNSISAFRGLQEQAQIGGREFKRYGEEIQRLEAKLSGLDGAATKAGASLGQKLAAGLAAAGVGRALQGITQQAASFDAELRKAAAISPTEGAFGTLKRSIEEVAAAAAGTPTDVAALATALSRAGFTADEVSASLAGVVKGAEATSISFDQMGGITADALRAFGMQVSQTNEVVDVLVKTANSSNQTVLDLGESLKFAAPTARSLGIDITELAGTLGVLANNGIRGSEAGTALRTGLSRLQLAASGSNDELLGLTRGNALLANAMRELGAEVTNADGSLKSMDEVFISLKRQIDNIASPGQRIEIVKAIFGEESGGKLRALLNSTEQDIKNFFEGVRNAAGTTDQTRAAMDSFQLSTKRLGGNIENLTNQIGGMIGAALKPLIDGLNEVIGASQRLPEPLKQIGAAAAAAGLAVTGLVVGIAGLKASLAIVGGVTALKGALLGAAGAAKALAAALLLNPWVAAAAGVAALTVAAYEMNEPFKEFVDTYPERFGTFWRELGSDADTVMQRVNRLAKRIGDFVGNIIKDIKDRAANAVKFIIDRAGILRPAIQAVADGMSSMFSSAFTMIQERWKETVSNMINYSNPLLAILKAIGIDVGGAFTAAMSTNAQRLMGAGSSQTYTVGGITYDTATGRPVSGAEPFARTPVPSGAVPLAVVPAGGGGGGQRLQAEGLQSQQQAAEQLKRQQDAATESLEKFVEARIQAIAKLKEEGELLNATTDTQQRQLEYLFEKSDIQERFNALEQEALKLQEEINSLGLEYNVQDQQTLINNEKQAALANARVKYEQEINDLMVERARMMQDVVRQSSGETVFNPLEQQKADLDALLEKYPAVGAAADAAATLATRGFSEMVTGARSAKEVFADFLRSISDALIDTAKTMIAQYIAIGIARMFAGLGGAGSSGDFSPSNVGPFGGSGLSTGLSFDPSGFGRAMGGPVSAGRAHPVGEKGPELFVPYQSGTIIPADVTEALAAANNAAQGPLLVPFKADSSSAAMQRPAAGASNGLSVPFQGADTSGSNGLSVPFQGADTSGSNGLSVPFQGADTSGSNGLSVPFLKGADGSDSAAGMVAIDNEPIRFESVMINSIEYVTRQEAEAIGKRSEQRTLKRMRNNPSVRRAAGLP
jgi:TP901 family phage tail tape measure protein